MTSLPYFTFQIGGLAGQGIKSIGLMFSKIAVRSGYWTYNHNEYPSLIRGGHNVMHITVADQKITAGAMHTDFLVALNQETVNLHTPKMQSGSAVLYDTQGGIDTSPIPPGIDLFAVPTSSLAKASGGTELMENIVALGAAMALLSGNLEILNDLIKEEFADKDPGVTASNLKAAFAGYNFAKENFSSKIRISLTPKDQPETKIVVNANDTVGLASVAAGVQFVAIYPMTPVTGLLHTLAPLQEQFHFIYKQPEDEISAINMAIGASYAGARSMTATSGGGFCLMTESIGLAGMTETPLVIIEGMRAGPATGLPTWSEQSDLRLVLHGHGGEIPNIVLAAGDPEEAFHLTMEAFNLAEIYQTPVIVLIDKLICEDDQSYRPFNSGDYQINRGRLTTQKVDRYLRYQLSPDGISPRTFPGLDNYYLTNSDEHNELGYDDESAANRKSQMEKRMAKLATCTQNHLPAPQLFGPVDADLTIVSWGSNKGAILEALKSLPYVNYLHLTWISPFPTDAVSKTLAGAKKILNLETNFTGQMASLISEKTGIVLKNNLLKYDGRPLYPEEIIDYVKSQSL